MKPILSVVLGSYNRRPFLKATLESVRKNGIDVPYEIIVVDGGSTDGSLNYLMKQKDVITIVQHNHGTFQGRAVERRSWGYFMNLAFKAAQGKYILMISDDCLVVPDSVKNGIEQFEKLLADGRKVGAMAFYWREWPMNSEYMVGKTFDRIFVNHGLYLREVTQQLNGFDEETYRFYHADADLCLRMWKAGFEVVDCADAYVEHFSHANVKVRLKNSRSQEADWEAYEKRWVPIYHDSTGSCLNRKFIDQHCTTEQFPRAAKNILLLNRIKKIIKTMLGIQARQSE